MAITMTCDREGCRSLRDVDFDVVPWEHGWVVLTVPFHDPRRLYFCSFACAREYVREKVANG